MNPCIPRLARPTLAITLLALSLGGCESLADLDNIDVQAEGRAVIPQRTLADQLIGPLTFAGFGDFDISQSQEFENQGYTKEQIDSVRIDEFTLTIEAPEGANFDFLDTVSFLASAEGLPDIEIARLDEVPPGVSRLELELDRDAELRPYVVAPSVTLTTNATGTRPVEETTVIAEAVFDVDVRVSGAL